MSDNRDAILDIVGKAYQIETDGYTFYSMTAERPQSRRPGAVLEAGLRRGPASGVPEVGGEELRREGDRGIQVRCEDAGRARSDVADLHGKFREQAAGAQFELAVLSIG